MVFNTSEKVLIKSQNEFNLPRFPSEPSPNGSKSREIFLPTFGAVIFLWRAVCLGARPPLTPPRHLKVPHFEPVSITWLFGTPRVFFWEEKNPRFGSRGFGRVSGVFLKYALYKLLKKSIVDVNYMYCRFFLP